MLTRLLSEIIISLAQRSYRAWQIAGRYVSYLCVKWLRNEALQEVFHKKVDKICRQRIPLAFSDMCITVFRGLAINTKT
jgi:hypothetical protein